ncbi:indole-3-glycerol phosphate synthase-domain-containing protein [Entophlyctis helioformis]|nr:indole-3-glycerol phosphate synthase-domain-containing protein [Entophlyctis helioformis]
MATLLVDNYDSFTWNVYQSLSELGADVRVFRNDQISLDEAIALNPRNVVISPGPGHPSSAGISNDIIRYFAGKVPVLGVCLGEQCMYEIYGGTVTYAGELIHGKTTPVIHDGQGLFDNVPQNIECTRYHSLAGDPRTLPPVLKVTARTASGIIMGVRHKDLVVEGVQFHPESIASEFGRRIFANFLAWEGGSWASLVRRDDLVLHVDAAAAAAGPSSALDDPSKVGAGISLAAISKMNSTAAPASVTSVPAGVVSELGLAPGHTAAHADAARVAPAPSAADDASSPSSSPSILQTIMKKRAHDVAADKARPGASVLHIQRSIALGLAPPAIDFKARLLSAGGDVAVLAEIKRASPSKGHIDMAAHAGSRALIYANAGAAAISVLTEPNWFKGSLSDMLQARLAIAHLPNRPAILRKEFILERYQIAEARLYGADSVLLIVACLSDACVADLMGFSRQLGMEPLVEVASADEMARALRLGAQVIGVNNRDLNTFAVDTSRTTALASLVPADVLLVALSGITQRSDIEPYLAAGARGVLVGEALMRAADKEAFIRSLSATTVETRTAGANGSSSTTISATRVKICGITKPEDALVAADAGADFIGLMFAPESPRCVDIATAQSIVRALHHSSGPVLPSSTLASAAVSAFPLESPAAFVDWFKDRAQWIDSVRPPRPLVVGVFTSQTVAEIQQTVDAVGLDLVQLHGGVLDAALPPLLSVPAVQVLHVDQSPANGSGQTLAASSRLVGQAAAVSHSASLLLLDTAVQATPSSAAIKGGSGVAFDWAVAETLGNLGVPMMLAGGLTPDTVRSAVQQVHPWAVDVSSGVEITGSKGVKDHDKIRRFVAQAKSI